VDTQEAIKLALEHGVEVFVTSIRNGPTSEDGKHIFGKGWHDFYRETTRTAGAHATLEGYLLCKVPGITRRLASFGLDPDREIFAQYLVPLFEKDEASGWPRDKEDQRSEAEVTTTKLAKFAQCCRFGQQPQSLLLGARVLKVLGAAQREETLTIGHSINANDRSVNPASSFAAAEVLRARYVWAGTDNERLRLLRQAWDFLSPADDPLHKSPWRLESIPWLKNALPLVHAIYTTCVGCLSKLSPDDPLRRSFRLVLHCILLHDYFLMGDMVIETYSFRDRFEKKSRTDYVSFESTLYLLQTIMSGVSNRLCPSALLDHIQPTLVAWKSAERRGYCDDALNPDLILPQKNRFSYLAAILKTLATAEESFGHANTLLNRNIPMFVNPIRFLDRGIVPDGRTAFLAIPFVDEPWARTLDSRLRKQCALHGFDLYRTDDLKDPRLDIPQKIWRDIWRSSFVVAVCDGKNPNVYYEIGLAHAIGKPVFLCASSRDHFTFDVNGIQYFVYDHSNGLESALGEFIENLRTNTAL